MPVALFICLILFSHLSWSLEIEGTYDLGAGETRVVLLGTQDFDAIEPVLNGFVDENFEVSIRYIQASSRAIDKAIYKGLGSNFDVIMSSAVDLQVKAVNDGYANSLSIDLSDATQWRQELVQIAIEPIVTIFNQKLNPDFSVIKTRLDLIKALDGINVKKTLMIYDPAMSGVGYLLSRQDEIQDAKFWTLLESFKQQDFRPVCCSSQMIDGVINGEADLAYNIVESYALPNLKEDGPLQIIHFDDYQIAIPRTAFIPKDSNQSAAGEKFISFFLSESGQNLLTPSTRLSVLDANSVVGGPLRPIRLSPSLIISLDRVAKSEFFDQWLR